jgi:hypothetical protein
MTGVAVRARAPLGSSPFWSPSPVSATWPTRLARCLGRLRIEPSVITFVGEVVLTGCLLSYAARSVRLGCACAAPEACFRAR